MAYKLPLERKIEVKSSLEPFFLKVRGSFIPGAHRLQKLLTDWLAQGILNMPSILVTGSNGKGTSCAFIESILREHDLKTGLYTSPHLIHPNERIRINGIPIAESVLEENIDIIIDAKKKYLPDASFFEISTATALLIFLKNNVEFLICEVGLGGKYDSTNAISPIISAITNVSLEHINYFGNSYYQIAYDKSHISRRNKPFIVGEINAQAKNGLYDACNKIGSDIIESAFGLNKKYECILNKIRNSSSLDNYNFPKMNIKNLSLSLTVLNELEKTNNIKFNFTENKINQAISKTYWPGRFDIRIINNRKVIFDASHNPDGLDYFIKQYLLSQFKDKKCVLLFSSLNDKNWKKSIEFMPKITKNIIFTQIPSERSESISHFSQYIENADLENFKFALSPQEDITCQYFCSLDSALETAMNHLPDLPLVITGSIAFIGTVMQRFGLSIFRGNE